MLKSYLDIPQDLKPIFIDEFYLVVKGNLKAALQVNLEKSNYLIVICSPNSAKSEYVNDEVNYFIKIGRADRIIPLIVEGKPYSDDASVECFTPAIRALLQEQKTLIIDIRKQGVHNAFLKIIAVILELDFDRFTSRHENIKSELEKLTRK